MFVCVYVRPRARLGGGGRARADKTYSWELKAARNVRTVTWTVRTLLKQVQTRLTFLPF